MINNDDLIDIELKEELADMESNSVDVALEMFFNSVLDCIVINEEMFLEQNCSSK